MKFILFSLLMASSAMAQNTLPSTPAQPVPTPEQCAQNPVYYCSTQGQCCDSVSNEGGGYSGVSVDPCSLPDYGLGCDSTDPLGAAACFCN